MRLHPSKRSVVRTSPRPRCGNRLGSRCEQRRKSLSTGAKTLPSLRASLVGRSAWWKSSEGSMICGTLLPVAALRVPPSRPSRDHKQRLWDVVDLLPFPSSLIPSWGITRVETCPRFLVVTCGRSNLNCAASLFFYCLFLKQEYCYG